MLIELFPFGRKKFAGELLPLLEEARTASPRPVVACSLRDILVGQRRDQQTHDERAAVSANRFFDAILVHSDPRFARLEESFHPLTTLRVPNFYTGFVSPQEMNGVKRTTPRKRQVVVSAGGGLVGEPLLRAAIEAHTLLRQTEDLEMKIIAGPFLPESDWAALCALARGKNGLTLHRFVPDLLAVLRSASASVSQCGYNTFLDILRSRVPALVVPFGEGMEDEQMNRARRLEQLGALRVLEQEHLNGERLAQEIRELLRFRPSELHLDLNGAHNAARILEGLVNEQLSGGVSPTREAV